ASRTSLSAARAPRSSNTKATAMMTRTTNRRLACFCSVARTTPAVSPTCTAFDIYCSDEDVVVRQDERGALRGQDARGLVVTLDRENVETGEDARVRANEVHEVRARQEERDRGMHGDDVRVRLAAKDERDLTHGVSHAERGDHERLAAFVTDDGDLSGRDE